MAESLYIPLSQNIEKYKNDVDLLLSVILGIWRLDERVKKFEGLANELRSLAKAWTMSASKELTNDQVQNYLREHPQFLEKFVTGPYISKETFQRWIFKRSNQLRRDTRRQLLSIYTVRLFQTDSKLTSTDKTIFIRPPPEEPNQEDLY